MPDIDIEQAYEAAVNEIGMPSDKQLEKWKRQLMRENPTLDYVSADYIIADYKNQLETKVAELMKQEAGIVEIDSAAPADAENLQAESSTDNDQSRRDQAAVVLLAPQQPVSDQPGFPDS